MRSSLMVSTIFALGLLTEPTFAAESATPAPPPVRPGVVEWLEPTSAVNRPQTEAEAKLGQQQGRALPKPELLQPDVDPALPHFKAQANLAFPKEYKVAASDVMPGLVQAWIDAFKVYHPNFKMRLQPPYAGSLGALELIKGNLDAVFVSRELKPSDISGFHQKFGHDPLSVPVSGGSWRHFGFLDAVVIMTNPENPVTHLSLRQLDAAFSKTRWRGGQPVTTWADLGVTGAFASHPVHRYGIKPWNGFEEFVRQRILSTPDHRGEWGDGIAFDKTFFNLARRVAADPDALAYTGLSAVDSEVKIVPVQAETEPPVSPSYENVAAALYPLARVTYFNTSAKDGRDLDPALHEFLTFVLSREGQDVVRRQAIYLPLRASQVEVSRSKLTR